MSGAQFESLAHFFVTPAAQERYQRLVGGDFEFESLQFGQLLLGFGEAKVEELIRSPGDCCQYILSSLCGLLGAEGYVVAQDKVFVPAVEFWSTLAESMADVGQLHFEESPEPWAAIAISHVLEAVSKVWRKIAYPPSHEFNHWDSNDRFAFSDARQDVVDFLQSAYALVGPQLAVTFSNITLSALSESDWPSLESAAFCLGGLYECGRDDAQFDDALTPVFASPLFSLLSSNAPIPHRARQTCLSLIEKYTEYFERNATFLAPAMRLLFTFLRQKPAAASAAKSILRLCSSCRYHLHAETSSLLHEYDSLTHAVQLDCLSSERVLGAIACVAQAIPETDRRQEACFRLLGFVRREVQRSQYLVTSSDSDTLARPGLGCCDDALTEQASLHVGLRALRCLLSIGKGFQSPPDAAIDLDADDVRHWKPGSGLNLLHDEIMGIILELDRAFGSEPQVTELIGSILRCGFSEIDDGPFVLRPETVVQFLTRHTGQMSRVGLLVGTACSFVSSLRLDGVDPQQQAMLSALLLWVVRLLKQLPGMALHDPVVNFLCTHDSAMNSRLT